MEEMKGQAEAVGTKMIQDHINEVDVSKKPFKAVGDSGQVYILKPGGNKDDFTSNSYEIIDLKSLY